MMPVDTDDNLTSSSQEYKSISAKTTTVPKTAYSQSTPSFIQTEILDGNGGCCKILKNQNSQKYNHHNQDSANDPSFQTTALPLSPSPNSKQITFDELLAKFSTQLCTETQLTPEQIDHEQLLEHLRQYRSNKQDWRKFALADSSASYTRNGIVDFEENANLLLLVWNPGKQSMIHDHAGGHCCMKILEGELTEELFDVPETLLTGHPDSSLKTTTTEMKKLTLLKTTTLRENQVSYISDKIGIHKMSNKTSKPAISLHLYTPPYAKKFGCNVYNSELKNRTTIETELSTTNDTKTIKTHVEMGKLYSWQGEIINVNHSSC
ncbi:unnamed protein product [Ambrosiozyma monospora]|uniref:Unnamed protein product n=1 Tax=Ambrosiozyma monospora TaxID=43982 RepID=A0ACB5SZF9_AMBMO|nr:unnamed protein product [Ambrosiozyma monospora]